MPLSNNFIFLQQKKLEALLTKVNTTLETKASVSELKNKANATDLEAINAAIDVVSSIELGPLASIVVTGTPSSNTYLRGDNTWATISTGSGTVTSIAAGTGLSGGTITSSGTLSINYGTTATTACVGNDSRLSDARTPTTHTHPASDIISGLAAVAITGVIINTQEFTASGTWTKPANAKMVFIRCIGGGAGGSGASTASGGAGGCAGQTAELWIPSSSLGTTETVTCGAAGTAGAAGTVNNGGTGGLTQFGASLWVVAIGGGGAGVLTQRTNDGGTVTGGFGAGIAAGAIGKVGRYNGPGGGGGGATLVTSPGNAGGAGGQGSWSSATVTNAGGGGAGGAVGTPGTAGTAGTVGTTGYGNGGGGGGGSSTTGGAGGAGIRGAGGGGGGRGTSAGGAGGAGGVGYCIVYTICG